ncbi:MAG TPA: prepilin-type N-terminal cleavage/methylation domain-containing protein [Candidatus Coproplasma stercoravium]|nr:prepilin-type N-terminal cleavage/methylation domain-containing protein [Candidatus Coproplasma stercoravium]
MQKLLKTCGMNGGGGLQSNSSLKQRIKRGFTIMELVIVIAVIAVLAAVLIPTFANVIERANLSNDTGTVRNINEALLADEVLNGKAETMGDALRVAREAGYDIQKISPSADGYVYAWDDEENQFRLLENNNGNFSVYYPEGAEITADKTWVIADDDNYADFQTAGYHIFRLTESSQDVADLISGGETDYILLGNDVDISQVLSLSSELDNITMDLNGNTLNIQGDNQADALVVTSDASLTISNGNISVDGSAVEAANITVSYGGELVLDSVNLSALNSTGIYLGGDSTNAAKLTIRNSTIKAEGYVIGTNAGTPGQSVDVTIENSVIEGDSDNVGTAFFLTIPGTINMTNVSINGYLQGVVLRGGGITANLTNCSIKNDMTVNSALAWNYFLSGHSAKQWGTGNRVPLSCLTIGNDATAPGGYNTTAPSTVTLTNCTFESIGADSSGHKYMTVYIEGANSTANVTLNYDSATAASIDGTGYGLVHGANVVINGAAMADNGSDCNNIKASEH